MNLQVLSLMRLVPADEDDRQAKAALYTKYMELLPAALTVGPTCSRKESPSTICRIQCAQEMKRDRPRANT